MPRIRTIKPEFFLDADLAVLPPHARLLFIGLWCLADREGRLPDDARCIKAQVFPYEDVDVTSILNTLSSHWITRYEVDGRKYLEIVTFSLHQKPHHTERISVFPSPHGDYTVTTRLRHGDKTGISISVRNHSTPLINRDNPVGREGKGRERKGSSLGGNGSPPPAARLTDDAGWIHALKDTYTWLDVDRELSKAQAWISTRGHRQLTRRFFVNWLNRVERPMDTKQKITQLSPESS